MENQTVNESNQEKSDERTDIEGLRYPIGQFVYHVKATQEDIDSWIGDIAETPHALEEAIAGLSQEQLNTAYRPEGWCLREVVHHIADSHMNGYIRFKLALTQNRPMIKPFQQNLWALLSDYDRVSAATSVKLTDALHERWTALLRTMTPSDFERAYVHPEDGDITLTKALQMYAWHSRHHIAHIVACRQRMNW